MRRPSGPTYPGTAMPMRLRLSPSGTVVLMSALATPGWLRAAASSRSIRSRRASGVSRWRLKDDSPSPPVSNPGVRRCCRTSAAASRPAAVRSTTDTVTCTRTPIRRRREPRRPLVTVPLSSLSSSNARTWPARHAGATPMMRPETSESPRPYVTSRQSSAVSNDRSPRSWSGRGTRASAAPMSRATASPARPPTTARQRHSVIHSMARRPRPAPSDCLMAISRQRAARRACITPARFAHVTIISRTVNA